MAYRDYNMAFLKQNWFKISILVLVLLLILKIEALNKFSSDNTEEQRVEMDNSQARSAYNDLLLKQNLPTHNTTCFPNKRLDCGESTCIENTNLGTTFTLISGPDKLSRCDRNGCDSYTVLSNLSGFYENLQPDSPRGLIFKRDLTTNDYIEFITIGLDSIFYRGKCEDI